MTATETPTAVQAPNTQACCTPSTCKGPDVSKKTFLPRADIFETKDGIELLIDMPGVDEKTLDITLEKNVMTIRGTVAPSTTEGYTAAYVEYDEGDYERAFTLADGIDRDSIKATIKNGVLNITLNKAAPLAARKIEIKATNA